MKKSDSSRVEFRETFGSKYWRLNHLYKIVNKKNKSKTFKFNQHQKKIWNECFENDVLIKDPNILKARQIGITTFFVLNYFDDCIWNENLHVYIQSHDEKSIIKIFRIISHAYKKMDSTMRPELSRGGGSMYEYHFEDINSRIYVGLSNRSSTIHRLHLSELAFQDREKIAATMGALPPGTHYSSETTPNGLNWYYDDWHKKSHGRKDMFFPWYDHSEYQLDIETGDYNAEERKYMDEIGKPLSKPQMEFRRKKINDLKSADLFDQEFPSNEETCFLTSGKHFFDIAVMRERKLECKPVIKSISTPLEKSTNEWKIAENYERGKQYLITADTSEGVDQGDYSAAKIWRLDTREEVAWFHGRPRYQDFANVLLHGSKLFSTKGKSIPILAVERNNHGHAVLMKLDETFNYWNLYSYSKGKLGWQTSSITRPLMLDIASECIEDETMHVNDPDFFFETNTFIERNGKFQAEDGKNDDRIITVSMAAAIMADNPGIGRMPSDTSESESKTLAGSLSNANNEW